MPSKEAGFTFDRRSTRLPWGRYSNRTGSPDYACFVRKIGWVKLSRLFVLKWDPIWVGERVFGDLVTQSGSVRFEPGLDYATVPQLVEIFH